MNRSEKQVVSLAVLVNAASARLFDRRRVAVLELALVSSRRRRVWTAVLDHCAEAHYERRVEFGRGEALLVRADEDPGGAVREHSARVRNVAEGDVAQAWVGAATTEMRTGEAAG